MPKNGHFVSPAPKSMVYVDSPPGYVVTVYFGVLSLTSEVASIMPTIKKIPTETDSVVSFKYECATAYKTTYYWAVGLCHPGEIAKTDD